MDEQINQIKPNQTCSCW